MRCWCKIHWKQHSARTLARFLTGAVALCPKSCFFAASVQNLCILPHITYCPNRTDMICKSGHHEFQNGTKQQKIGSRGFGEANFNCFVVRGGSRDFAGFRGKHKSHKRNTLSPCPLRFLSCFCYTVSYVGIWP